MEEKQESCNLERNDRLLLEGYRNMSFWNHHDAQAVLAFDKIFIPLILGAPVYTVIAESEVLARNLVIGGSVILLTTWFLLSMRYRASMVIRYEIMHEIESTLKFCAHRKYHEKRKNRAFRWLTDKNIRIIFFCLVVGGLFVLAAIDFVKC